MAIKGVSIVIAVWNQLPYTRLTVDAILKNTHAVPMELVIVDNGSDADVLDYFDSLKKSGIDIKYIRNEENRGPIIAINQGIRASKFDYVCVMHNDVLILEDGWMNKILQVMDNDPKIGIAGLVGRKEIYKTGCVNEASIRHNLRSEDLDEPMKEDISEVAVIDGLCFVMRRAFLEKTKGLDESYGYMHCYDLDISLQSVEAGYKNVVVNVSAMHIGNGGMTRRLADYKILVKDDYGLLKKNCRIFADKWKHMLPRKIS